MRPAESPTSDSGTTPGSGEEPATGAAEPSPDGSVPAAATAPEASPDVPESPATQASGQPPAPLDRPDQSAPEFIPGTGDTPVAEYTDPLVGSAEPAVEDPVVSNRSAPESAPAGTPDAPAATPESTPTGVGYLDESPPEGYAAGTGPGTADTVPAATRAAAAEQAARSAAKALRLQDLATGLRTTADVLDRAGAVGIAPYRAYGYAGRAASALTGWGLGKLGKAADSAAADAEAAGASRAGVLRGTARVLNTSGSALRSIGRDGLEGAVVNALADRSAYRALGMTRAQARDATPSEIQAARERALNNIEAATPEAKASQERQVDGAFARMMANAVTSTTVASAGSEDTKAEPAGDSTLAKPAANGAAVGDPETVETATGAPGNELPASDESPVIAAQPDAAQPSAAEEPPSVEQRQGEQTGSAPVEVTPTYGYLDQDPRIAVGALPLDVERPALTGEAAQQGNVGAMDWLADPAYGPEVGAQRDRLDRRALKVAQDRPGSTASGTARTDATGDQPSGPEKGPSPAPANGNGGADLVLTASPELAKGPRSRSKDKDGGASGGARPDDRTDEPSPDTTLEPATELPPEQSKDRRYTGLSPPEDKTDHPSDVTSNTTHTVDAQEAPSSPEPAAQHNATATDDPNATATDPLDHQRARAPPERPSGKRVLNAAERTALNDRIKNAKADVRQAEDDVKNLTRRQQTASTADDRAQATRQLQRAMARLQDRQAHLNELSVPIRVEQALRPVSRLLDAIDEQWSNVDALRAGAARGERLSPVDRYVLVLEGMRQQQGIVMDRVQIAAEMALTSDRPVLGRLRYLARAKSLPANVVVQMLTGEGKTAVESLAAFRLTLEHNARFGGDTVGYRVDVFKRNSEDAYQVYAANQKLANALGVRLGYLEPDRELDGTIGLPEPRQSSAVRDAQYGSDILYGTAYEFGFDQMRDDLANKPTEGSQPSEPDGSRRRTYSFAIVDEIDEAMLDIGRNPLILAEPASGDAGQANDRYQATELAEQLPMASTRIDGKGKVSIDDEAAQRIAARLRDQLPDRGADRPDARQHRAGAGVRAVPAGPGLPRGRRASAPGQQRPRQPGSRTPVHQVPRRYRSKGTDPGPG